MKSIIKSIAVAFSLYSTVPMPLFEWQEKNMKYAIAFFHLIGVLQGAVFLLFYKLTDYFYITPILFASISIVVSFLITGGIHLDGFCDTCDGIFCHADRKKRLEVLKDSHAGAFAVIGLCMLLVLRFGAYTQLFENKKYILLVGVSFVLSRLYSGLSVLIFKKAKKDGLVATFSQNSLKKTSVILVSIFICFWSVLSIEISFEGGIMLITVMNLYFLFYKIKSYKLFGGVTGDLAGFFLETSETLSLLALSLLGAVIR